MISRTRAVLADALGFVARFALFSLLAYALFSLVTPSLQAIAAGSSALFLNAMGKQAVALYPPVPFDPLLRVQGLPFDAALIPLCGAGLELALVFGFLFASTDRSLKHRLYGFLTGTTVILLFNALRISVTLFFFSSDNLSVSVFLHDAFFRVFLLVVLIGFYAVWYYWLSKPVEKPVRTKKKRTGARGRR